LENKTLASDAWYDQEDAHDFIDSRLHSRYGSDIAQILHTFVEDGYALLHAALDDRTIDQVTADVDDYWRRKSVPAIYSGHKGLRTLFKGLDPEQDRVPGYRLPDLHGYSDACLRLTMNAPVFLFLEALYQRPAIGFQSLYFEWGSQQGLHRDPMFVRSETTSALLAS